MIQNKVKYFLGAVAILLIASPFFISCDWIGDRLRSYGEQGRRTRALKLDREEIEKWKRDLSMSEERINKINEEIHDLVQESNLQGMLAWKIAKAYTREKRYSMASDYYEAAFENRLPSGETVEAFSTEDSLPFFSKALKRHRPDPELLFDAGLAFANASKDMGWEESRWKTALFLFERMVDMKPDDLRPPYQLALLYAFTTKPELRNPDRALEYLERIVGQEETNIPARFAMAHIHVMEGRYEKGRGEYVRIKEVIENMYGSGVLSGTAQQNPQYRKAVQNIEKLDFCIEGNPQCELSR